MDQLFCTTKLSLIMVWVIILIQIIGVLSSCGTGCTACFPSSSGSHCYDCDSGYYFYLFQYKCYETCPPYTYPIFTDYLTCNFCNEACKICFDNQNLNCFKCNENSNYYPDGLGICREKICGDGYKLIVEECDDGNNVSGDGCSSSCSKETGWICNIMSNLTSSCAPICGDGLVMLPYEQCDDGNTLNWDGCNSICSIEPDYYCYGGNSAHASNCTCEPMNGTAAFSNDWLSIIITYGKPLKLADGLNGNIKSKMICDKIFKEEFTKLLGMNYSCVVMTDLTITLGSNSNVTSNDQILFIPNTFYQTKCIQHHTLSLQLNMSILSGPLIPPAFNLTGSNIITPCDNYTLNLSIISGTCGRLYSTKWSVINSWPLESLIKYNQMLNSSNFTNSTSVVIPAGTFTAKTRYTIEAEVTNFLGLSAKKEIIVYTTKETYPILNILGSSQQTTRPALETVLKVDAYGSTCPQVPGMKNYQPYGKDKIYITWTQGGGGNSLLNISRFYDNSIQPFIITLPPFFGIKGESYTFVITVAFAEDIRLATTQNLTLKILGSTLMSIITGGDRMASNQAPLALDGSQSYDPDSNPNSPTILKYYWGCKDSKSRDCLDAKGNSLQLGKDNIITIPALTLVGGMNYTFELTISADSRSSSSSINVILVQGDIPICIVEIPKNKEININDDYVIYAKVYSKYPDSINYLWNVTQINPDQTSTGIDGKYLKIPAWTFKPGIVYNFSANIQDQGGKSYVSISLKTNIPPSDGLLLISPEIGSSFETSFNIQALYWTDDDLPLTYQFYLYYSKQDINNPNKKIILSQVISYHSIQRKLPNPLITQTNNQLYIQVIVYDFNGGLSNCTTTIVANPLSFASNMIDITTLETKISTLLNGPFNDPYEYMYNIQLSQALLTSNFMLGIDNNCNKNGYIDGSLACQCDPYYIGDYCNVAQTDLSSLIDIKLRLINETQMAFASLSKTASNIEQGLVIISAVTNDISTNNQVIIEILMAYATDILSILSNNSNTISISETTVLLKIISSILDNSYRTNVKYPYEDMLIQANYSDYLSSLTTKISKLLILNTVPNESPYSIVTSTFSIIGTRVTPQQLLGLQIGALDTSSYGATFKLPKTGLMQIPNRTFTKNVQNDLILGDLVALNWNSNPYQTTDSNQTILSNVCSLSLKQPGTDNIIPVQNLSEPIIMNIPLTESIPNNTGGVRCSYWNSLTSTWNQKGCSLINVTITKENHTLIYCSCNHLTDFSLIFSTNIDDISSLQNSNFGYLENIEALTNFNNFYKTGVFYILIAQIFLLTIFMIWGFHRDRLSRIELKSIARHKHKIRVSFNLPFELTGKRIRKFKRHNFILDDSKENRGAGYLEAFVHALKVIIIAFSIITSRAIEHPQFYIYTSEI